MNRRGFLGAMAACLMPSVKNEEPDAEPIKGVGVLHFPADSLTPDVKAFVAAIRQGSIICLPNTRDADGNLLWDFKIEGGDPGQVKVERSGQ